MNSDFSRSVVSSASLRSRSARSTRVESVTSRKVKRLAPSGSGTWAHSTTEPSARSRRRLRALGSVDFPRIRSVRAGQSSSGVSK